MCAWVSKVGGPWMGLEVTVGYAPAHLSCTSPTRGQRVGGLRKSTDVSNPVHKRVHQSDLPLPAIHETLQQKNTQIP